MKLNDAARYFDRTSVFDGYSDDYLWKCQFSSFNDANVVGSTSTRRTLSIAPGLEIPERKTIRILESRWLVGDGNPDAWGEDAIRQSFNMKKATDLAEILSPSEACQGLDGIQAYCHKVYLKDTVDAANNSDYDPFWNIFFAPNEPVGRARFIRTPGKLFRARSDYLPIENLRVVAADEVDLGPVSAIFANGTYDPVTDTWIGGALDVPILLMDFNKAYVYLTERSDKVRSGDMTGFVPKSLITPKVGDTLTAGGEDWRIQLVHDEMDAWMLHLRPN